MRNKTSILFLLHFSIFCVSQNPWLQGKGETLISPSVSHYFTDSQRDKNNVKSDFVNNGFYENYVYKVYFSTSLIGNKLNLIGNLPFVASKYKDDFTNAINNELGDAELGAKIHLKKIGEFHYLIGTVSAIIPLYKNNKAPFIAFGKFGSELKINISGNSKWMGVNANYHQLELSFRNFFDGPLQYKLYGAQGYRITKKLTLLGELEILISKGNNVSLSQENIQFITDFDFVKSSLSIGYKFSSKFELFAGEFRDLYNRNISIGRGWQVFGVIKM